MIGKRLVYLFVRIRRERGANSMATVIQCSPLAAGASYHGDSLPVQRWQWPTGTFLQRRRAELAAGKTLH